MGTDPGVTDLFWLYGCGHDSVPGREGFPSFQNPAAPGGDGRGKLTGLEWAGFRGGTDSFGVGQAS